MRTKQFRRIYKRMETDEEYRKRLHQRALYSPSYESGRGLDRFGDEHNAPRRIIEVTEE